MLYSACFGILVALRRRLHFSTVKTFTSGLLRRRRWAKSVRKSKVRNPTYHGVGGVYWVSDPSNRSLFETTSILNLFQLGPQVQHTLDRFPHLLLGSQPWEPRRTTPATHHSQYSDLDYCAASVELSPPSARSPAPRQEPLLPGGFIRLFQIEYSHGASDDSPEAEKMWCGANPASIQPRHFLHLLAAGNVQTNTVEQRRLSRSRSTIDDSPRTRFHTRPFAPLRVLQAN